MSKVNETAYCHWNEIEPLINLLHNTGMSDAQISVSIGWSVGMLSYGRQEGRARVVTKYALMGLVAENADKIRALTSNEAFTLTYEDAELLFDLLRFGRQSYPQRMAAYNRMQARLAQEMVKLSK